MVTAETAAEGLRTVPEKSRMIRAADGLHFRCFCGGDVFRKICDGFLTYYQCNTCLSMYSPFSIFTWFG